jgi:hypothetical protein
VSASIPACALVLLLTSRHGDEIYLDAQVLSDVQQIIRSAPDSRYLFLNLHSPV